MELKHYKLPSPVGERCTAGSIWNSFPSMLDSLGIFHLVCIPKLKQWNSQRVITMRPHVGFDVPDFQVSDKELRSDKGLERMDLRTIASFYTSLGSVETASVLSTHFEELALSTVLPALCAIKIGDEPKVLFSSPTKAV